MCRICPSLAGVMEIYRVDEFGIARLGGGRSYRVLEHAFGQLADNGINEDVRRVRRGRRANKEARPSVHNFTHNFQASALEKRHTPPNWVAVSSRIPPGPFWTPLADPSSLLSAFIIHHPQNYYPTLCTCMLPTGILISSHSRVTALMDVLLNAFSSLNETNQCSYSSVNGDDNGGMHQAWWWDQLLDYWQLPCALPVDGGGSVEAAL